MFSYVFLGGQAGTKPRAPLYQLCLQLRLTGLQSVHAVQTVMRQQRHLYYIDTIGAAAVTD